MSERTEDLRREIDAGRERLGETAGAIGYKTDVPSRARDRVGAVKERITGAGPSAGEARRAPVRRSGSPRRTRWDWPRPRSRRGS